MSAPAVTDRDERKVLLAMGSGEAPVPSIAQIAAEPAGHGRPRSSTRRGRIADMRLCDTEGNRLRPTVGSKVIVHAGGPMTPRQIEGHIVRTTATQIVVSYAPNVKSDRTIAKRFRKKDGCEVGGFRDGPRVSLVDDE